jgi:hypothetical protein
MSTKNRRRSSRTRNTSRKSSSNTKAFNGGISRDNLLTVPFNDVLTFTWVASTTPKTVTLNSDLTVRSTAFAALYVNYRIKRLDLQLMPYSDTTTASNQVVLAFYPNIGVSAPSSYNQVAEQGNGVVHSTVETVPTKFSIPSSALKAGNSMPWLPCNTSSLYTNNFGYLIAIPYGSSTGTLLCKMRCVMEFSYPTNSSVEKPLTMDEFRLIAAKQDQERKLLFEMEKRK